MLGAPFVLESVGRKSVVHMLCLVTAVFCCGCSDSRDELCAGYTYQVSAVPGVGETVFPNRGRPFAEAETDSGPMWVLIDTGAATSRFSASRLAREGVAQDFTLGGMRFSGIQGGSFTPDLVKLYDAVIGADVLCAAPFVLAMQEGRFSFGSQVDDRMYELAQVAVLESSDEAGQRLSLPPVHVVIDTATIALPLLTASAVPLVADGVLNAVGGVFDVVPVTGAGENMPVSLVRPGIARLLGVRSKRENAVLGIPRDAVASGLGGDMLRDVVIRADLQRGELEVWWRPLSPLPIWDSYRRPGVRLNTIGMVVQVYPFSSAGQSGIALGDLVRSVAGREGRVIDYLSWDNLLEEFRVGEAVGFNVGGVPRLAVSEDLVPTIP
jgi:hypothetical protein